MERSLSSAASAMAAEEMEMSVIADNLANVNTPGFKKSRAEFQSLMYDVLANNQSIHLGHGVKIAGTQRDPSSGALKQTGNPFDMAVQGVGYFQLQKPDGSEIYYSRDGSFRLDNQGRLVNLDGYLVMPNITVPPNATGTLKVNPNGTITMLNADLNNEVELGYIQIVSFPNENGLLPQGKNLYAASSTSGLPTMGNPGTLGLGALTQGFLEMSNVKPIEEMVALIATQRAYEQATRVMEAANQMLGQTSNIRT